MSAFDHSTDLFGQYGQQVRGYVRYLLVQRNLKPYLSHRELNILDVQGGSGIDAAWLANDGHQVTLLEESPKQLEAAWARFAMLPGIVKQRIRPVQGNFSVISKAAGSFDVVLCHGVAMYQKQPETFLAEVGSYAKPKGVVSVLEKGFGGIKQRFEESDQDQTKALDRLKKDQRFINTLGHDVYAFHPAQLISCLVGADVDISQWFGVRVDTDQDKRLVKELSPEVLASVIEAEYLNSVDPHKKQLGHMLHIIGFKN